MDAYSIFMLALLAVFMVLIVLSAIKKRKMASQTVEMRAELKNGDKVMTDSGIAGEIVDSYQEEGYKYFVLKTGKGDHTSYLSVHSNAIYYVFGKDQQVAQQNLKVEEKIEEKSVESTNIEQSKPSNVNKKKTNNSKKK